MFSAASSRSAPSQQIYAAPHHPYTEALLSAAPHPDPKKRPDRIILRGDVPSPSNVPPGCAFHRRCPDRHRALRARERPPLVEVEPGRRTACHYAAPYPILRRQSAA